MPSKLDKISVGKKFDRRIKLTPEQRKEVKLLSKNLSQRALARKYGVSRRLIQFIIDPTSYKEHLKKQKENKSWQKYYDKESHRISIQKLRNYKKQLKEEGKI